MAHTCHAIGCDTPVAPRLLMCRTHWATVPRACQQAVYVAYVPGQERTKTPTDVYLRAAARAIIAVAEYEGKTIPPIYRMMAGAKEEEWNAQR